MIWNIHHSQDNQLLIYCRGTSPNPMQTRPMWTESAVAFRQEREIGTQATTVGANTSHRDVMFRALVDATELTKNILTTSPARSVIIYTADHQVIPWCLITDRHNNTLACRVVSKTLSNILFNHPNTSMSIKWIPGSARFYPLKRILEVATEAAGTVDLTEQQPPPSIMALKHSAKLQALSEWEQVWLKDPCQNPAYQALHHPLSGQPPEFITRIESFAQPIFCTAICLLTKHAFTGKYNARHRPQAPNPHDCQCRQTPLQTVDHIIT
jgi:hypothetical protein